MHYTCFTAVFDTAHKHGISILLCQREPVGTAHEAKNNLPVSSSLNIL